MKTFSVTSSVDTTVDKLKAGIEAVGLRLVTHINGQANAKLLGKDVPGDQILEIFRPDFAIRVWQACKPAAVSDITFDKYICDACGYIYDEAKGDPDGGLPPGTRFADIPEDWQCPLCGLGKSDLRPLPAPKPRTPRAERSIATKKSATCRGGNDYVVIIGAGIAGWSVAEAIRQLDAEIPLLIVTACEGLVYPKPALSMAMAQGKQAEQLIDQQAMDKADELNIELRTETRVIKIDTGKQRITTAKGGINYGKLVLALGAHQRDLPIGGDAAGQVLKVNDLATYRTLRNRLDGGPKHITLLGAGLIGSEFAEDFSSSGHQVTVVEPGDLPLERLLPMAIAQSLRNELAAKGVNFRFHATLDQLNQHEDRLQAILSNGDRLDTDV
ncbi:unnamed protein product, partial [Cyprideis torosa]